MGIPSVEKWCRILWIWSGLWLLCPIQDGRHDAILVLCVALKWPGSIHLSPLGSQQLIKKGDYFETTMMWVAQATWRGPGGRDLFPWRERGQGTGKQQRCEWGSHLGSGPSSSSCPDKVHEDPRWTTWISLSQIPDPQIISKIERLFPAPKFGGGLLCSNR